MKYQLITAMTDHELNTLINRMLKDGWELYGNPFGNNHQYCQAVVMFTTPTLPNFIPKAESYQPAYN